MHKPQEQVREFHREVTKHPTSLAKPMLRNPELRAKLILEEALETVEALVGSELAAKFVRTAMSRTHYRSAAPNLVEAIDGCCDLLVVTYGTLEDIGVDGEPFFDEVHRSNMAKGGGIINEHGKLLKPPGWKPPDIQGILEKLL